MTSHSPDVVCGRGRGPVHFKTRWSQTLEATANTSYTRGIFWFGFMHLVTICWEIVRPRPDRDGVQVAARGTGLVNAVASCFIVAQISTVKGWAVATNKAPWSTSPVLGKTRLDLYQSEILEVRRTPRHSGLRTVLPPRGIDCTTVVKA